MSAESLPIPPELLLGEEPPFTDADIDRWLDEPVMEVDPDDVDGALARFEEAHPPARWVIDGTNTAAWSMAKLSGIASEMNTLAEQAREWQDRIDAWYEQKAKPLERRAAFFEGHLKDYALRVREASGDEIKTVTLPSGVVKTTAHKAVVTVEDAEAFVDWARGLDPEDYQAVVLVWEQPIVSGIRAMVEMVPVAQRVILSCGCAEVLTDDGRLERVGTTSSGASWAPGCWGRVWLGDGVVCPSCGEEVLVGRIVASYLEAQHPSLGDVPGLGVEPASVTAKAVPDAG